MATSLGPDYYRQVADTTQARSRAAAGAAPPVNWGGGGEDSNLIASMLGGIANGMLDDLRSIPHIIPLAMNPGSLNDPNVPEEERRLRRKALANAAFIAAQWGAAEFGGPLLAQAPKALGLLKNMAVMGALSQGVGAAAYESVERPPGEANLGGAFVAGAVQGGLFHMLHAGIRSRLKGKGGLETNAGGATGAAGAAAAGPPTPPPLGTMDAVAHDLAAGAPPWGDKPEDLLKFYEWTNADPQLRQAAHAKVTEEQFNHFMGLDTELGQTTSKLAGEPAPSAVPTKTALPPDARISRLRDQLGAFRVKQGLKNTEEQIDWNMKTFGKRSMKELDEDGLRAAIKSVGLEPVVKPRRTPAVKVQAEAAREATAPGAARLARGLEVPVYYFGRNKPPANVVFPDELHQDLFSLGTRFERKMTPEQHAALAQALGEKPENLARAAQIYRDAVKAIAKGGNPGDRTEMPTFEEALDHLPDQVTVGREQALARLSAAPEPPKTKGQTNGARAQREITNGGAPLMDRMRGLMGQLEGKTTATPPEIAPPVPPEPPKPSAKELVAAARERWAALPRGVRPFDEATSQRLSKPVRVPISQVEKGTQLWFEGMEEAIGEERRLMAAARNASSRIPGQIERHQSEMNRLIAEYDAEVKKHGLEALVEPRGGRQTVQELPQIKPGSRQFLSEVGGNPNRAFTTTRGAVSKALKGDIFTFWNKNPKTREFTLDSVEWQPWAVNKGAKLENMGVVDDQIQKALWQLYHANVRRVDVNLKNSAAVDAMRRLEQQDFVARVPGDANTYVLKDKAGVLPDVEKIAKGQTRMGRLRAYEKKAARLTRATVPAGTPTNRMGLPENKPAPTIVAQGRYVPETAGERFAELWKTYTQAPTAEKFDPNRSETWGQGLKDLRRQAEEEYRQAGQVLTPDEWLRQIEGRKQDIRQLAKDKGRYEEALTLVNPVPEIPPAPLKGSRLQRPEAAGAPTRVPVDPFSGLLPGWQMPNGRRIMSANDKAHTPIGQVVRMAKAMAAGKGEKMTDEEAFKWLKANEAKMKGWWDPKTRQFITVAELEPFNGDIQAALAAKAKGKK